MTGRPRMTATRNRFHTAKPKPDHSRKYGPEHQRLRAHYNKQVQAGQAYCQQGLKGSSGRCHYRTRWIPPGTPWQLGHDDTGTHYIGPCHPRCNQRDGARRGGQAAATTQRPRTTWHSQTW
jgi:hypothetical protein